jgi:DnaJ-class molecular chaperone
MMTQPDARECPECSGAGRIMDTDPFSSVDRECRKCCGTGNVNRPHLFDVIHAACQRPASLGYIAQQIGMTPSEAFWAVAAAEENGFIRRGRYHLYEAIP